MNLLLLDPSELRGDQVVLTGRRAAHLRGVLGVAPGSTVRAGLVGGALGEATVVRMDGPGEDDPVALDLRWTAPPSTPMPVELVLAVPRPKVLTRVLETAASFGVTRVQLVNAWRVDKAYLDSPRLAPDALREATLLGAEQGATTHVPEVTVHRRLMAYFASLDASLDTSSGAALAPRGPLLCAHPRQGRTFAGVPLGAATTGSPAVLAIGPEGGWISREVETFEARGFHVVSLGAPILRVEAAVAAALGQLTLLMARADGP